MSNVYDSLKVCGIFYVLTISSFGKTAASRSLQKSHRDGIGSVYTTPEFKAGKTYLLFINGEKKLDITPEAGMNAIGDDGGKFTGGCSRGNMASLRN